MKTNYYVVRYQSGARGCPVFFDADLNHDWQWEIYDADPDKFEITADYVFKAKHRFINFDFECDDDVASEHFLRLCNQFGMRYRAIPVEMIQSNKKPTQKKYFFLLSKDYKTIIDMQKSEYELARVLETGEVCQSKLFPLNPYFEKITRFVIDEEKIADSHIFRCTDIGYEYVCDQQFKDECEREKLLGLKFVPIDESYKWDPYGDSLYFTKLS